MACYFPIKGYRTPGGQIKLSPSGAFVDRPMTVACGQCTGCRISRSKMWAARCIHEASLYENNAFITLTYHDSQLPEGGTLVLRHFQLFMKRLRKKYGSGIRFFHCGEYGDKLGRPHYHALLFNHDFADKVLWKKENGIPLYLSADLTELWPMGFSTVGAVTYETAAYTARYIMKKISGPIAELHYENIDEITGQIVQRTPEYITMSRKPGIGTEWYNKYKTDLWPDDFLVVHGRKTRIPRFYDNLFSIEHPVEMERFKRLRIRKSLKHKENNTPERLAVRHKVQLARISKLKREIE